MTHQPWLTDEAVLSAQAAVTSAEEALASARATEREAQKRTLDAEEGLSAARQALRVAQADAEGRWAESLPLVACWALPIGARKPYVVQLHGEPDGAGWWRVLVPRTPGPYDRDRSMWRAMLVSADKPRDPYGMIPGGQGRLWLVTP